MAFFFAEVAAGILGLWDIVSNLVRHAAAAKCRWSYRHPSDLQKKKDIQLDITRAKFVFVMRENSCTYFVFDEIGPLFPVIFEYNSKSDFVTNS